MEWLLAVGFALLMLVWSALFLLRKVLRLGPPAKELAKQLERLAEAKDKVPELAQAKSALEDDPAIHLARRQQLLREARARKRQRERRLRARDF